MIVSIHQPNFIPWLGYFYKIAHSDIFVILDDVEYTKNSFINRSRIKSQQGEQWLTIPVSYSGNSKALINEMQMQNFRKQRKKLLHTVRQSYSKAEYFNEFFPQFEEILTKYNENLSELNQDIINWVCSVYNLQTPKVLSSSYNVETASTHRLVDIVKAVNGTEYLHGKGGVNYQDEDLFKAENIKLTQSSFNVQEYNQLGEEFISHMSVIDYIFNCGSKSPF